MRVPEGLACYPLVFKRMLMFHPGNRYFSGKYCRIKRKYLRAEYGVIQMPDYYNQESQQSLVSMGGLCCRYQFSREVSDNSCGKPQYQACYDHKQPSHNNSPILKFLFIVIPVALCRLVCCAEIIPDIFNGISKILLVYHH